MIARRLGSAGVVLVIAAVLSGCSLLSDQREDVPASGPVAYYPMPSDGLTEKTTGTLTVTASCIVITDADGAVTLPVFPVGDATWDGASLTYDGKAYADGAKISLSGAPVENGMYGPVTYIPADCDRSVTFFVAPTKN